MNSKEDNGSLIDGKDKIPVPQKESYIIAQKMFADGDRLYRLWQEESIKSAIQEYSKARLHWQSAGYSHGETIALQSIGRAYFALSEYQKALDHYKEALEVSRSAESSDDEISALNNISYTQIYLGENQSALENCEKAFQLSRQSNNRTGEAQSLNIMGAISYRTGDLSKALDILSRAQRIWRSIPDHPGKAQAVIYMGHTNADMGKLQEAMDCFREAVSISEQTGNLLVKARALSAIGGLNNLLGEFQYALNSHIYALELFQKIGNREGEAITFNNLGGTHELLGEFQKALDYYTQANEIYRDIGNYHSEACTTDYIGKIHLELGNYMKALDIFNQGLLRARAINDQLLEGMLLNDLGTAYNSFGKKQEALSYFNMALISNRETEARREQVYTLNNIGRTLEDIGEQQKVLDYYREALTLSQSVQDRRAETLTLYNIARFEFKHGNYTEAYSILNQSLQMIESLRTKVAGQEFRASYFESVRQHYELYIDLLMQMQKQNPMPGLAAAALEASEQARARTLLEILTEAKKDIRKGVDLSLLERERSLYQALNAKAIQQDQLLRSPHSQKEAEAIDKEIDDLSTAYEEIQSRIRGESPRYAALIQPEPLDLQGIQQEVLDSDTMLLEYSLGEDHSYLWAVTKTSFESFELPGRDSIEKSCLRVGELLSFRQNQASESYQQRVRSADLEFWKEAVILSRTLLGPVSDLLQSKRLVIVAEGAMQHVPFGVLPKPPHNKDSTEEWDAEEVVPLIVDHEIIRLPSASVLAVLRKETGERLQAPKTLAVFADPVFEPDDPRVVLRKSAKSISMSNRSNFPRLPGTRTEAETILAYSNPGSSLRNLSFKASKENAKGSELSEYRIIHFATHGLLNSRQPGLSALILSLVDEKGQSQDGYLRLADIYNLNLPAELVVLSACNSGLGEDVRGEALMGMVRGFMYAGAERVVASLWKVDDQATSELMKRFYYHMLKLEETPASALRSAQTEMWQQDQWKFPFYWASFVLQGEWR